MTRPVDQRRRPPLLEYGFALLVLVGVINAFWFFYQVGYFPQPYFYEPWGTWMDFIAVAYWAHNPGAFDTWGTIYPPLSFAVLKFISWGKCYDSNFHEFARDCDIYGIVWIHISYVIAGYIAVRCFLKNDRHTAIPRSFALIAGLPMTYALERGNLILLCFACVMLAYGPLVRSARLRWLFAGLAVNFKVYLVGTLLAHLLKRRWRWFEGALIATILVYLVSFAIYGAGSPWEVYDNIVYYASGVQAGALLDLWYPSSLIPLQTLLEGDIKFPIAGVIGSRLNDLGLVLVGVIMRGVQLSIVIAAAAAWWRPQVVSMNRLIFLSMSMALISSEVSGYTHMMAIFFVFMERWKGIGRPTAIILAYILCIGIDMPIEHAPPVVRDSFLSGRAVIAYYAAALGSLTRPVLFHLMVLTLALTTIREVWADARLHGWRYPWERRRDRFEPAPEL